VTGQCLIFPNLPVRVIVTKGDNRFTVIGGNADHAAGKTSPGNRRRTLTAAILSERRHGNASDFFAFPCKPFFISVKKPANAEAARLRFQKFPA
jgi:hypothetical protein